MPVWWNRDRVPTQGGDQRLPCLKRCVRPPLVLTFPQAKLSVYPEPDKPITVVETRTELERQMGLLRQKFQHYTGDMFRSLRSGIDSVVNAEHRVESMFEFVNGIDADRMSSLWAKDESVTPNALYVGVATLASMVFTRHRM